MGSTKALLVICVVHILFGLDITRAKPANSDSSSSPSQIQATSGPLSSSSSHHHPVAGVVSSEPRRVVTSWSSSDNVWQASARLPSSSQTGRNQAGTSSTKDLTTTNGQRRTLDPTIRNNRRLHKWEKTEEVSDEQSETENNDEGGGEGTNNLAQSLNSMASHLLNENKGDDQSLENSSERDVFINKNEQQQQQQDGSSTDQNETDETSSDEEASPTNGPKTAFITTWHDGGEDGDDQDKMLDKQKSDGNPTTPKGLTTWSAVNGGGGSYIKGSIQKIIPSEHTVSGALSFTTDRLSTANMDFVTKERSTSTSASNPTTEIPRTTKAANNNNNNNNIAQQTSATASSTIAMLNSNSNNPKRRKPYHKNKKVVQPSKFVKPPLAEITAEPIGTDATHTIYKTKVIDPQSKIGGNDFPYTTKKPQWPYQMPAKKIVTTKRPMAFSRITAKPKNPYPKKPGSPTALYSVSSSTQTTTVPPSTTVYHRNPAPLMYPFPSISFTNLGFMDFLRSQIIPRIGLSLISFMAASPLILSMITASAVGRRKKRSLLDKDLVDTDRVQFEYISNKPPNTKDLPKFDFSTIKKKLYKLEMIHHKKPKKSVVTQVTEIVSKLMNTKGFSMLKSKFFKAHDDSPKDSNVNDKSN